MANIYRHKTASESLGNIFVRTTIVQGAFNRLDQLALTGWQVDTSAALLISGESGTGKTRAVKEWVQFRQTEHLKGYDGMHAVYVEVPPKCSLRGLASQILLTLGDPTPDYGSETELTRRVAETAEREQVDVIILDEIQRLIDEGTGKVKKDLANWVTSLINKRACLLVFLGEPHSARIFGSSAVSLVNGHAQRRTSGEYRMRPYDWSDSEQRKEFRVIMSNLDRELGFPESSSLSATDTSIRLHAFSQGRLGFAAQLITTARFLAERANMPRITHDAFADAVDQLRFGEVKKEPNPFRMFTPQPWTPQEIENHDEPNAHVPRRRNRKGIV